MPTFFAVAASAPLVCSFFHFSLHSFSSVFFQSYLFSFWPRCRTNTFTHIFAYLANMYRIHFIYNFQHSFSSFSHIRSSRIYLFSLDALPIFFFSFFLVLFFFCSDTAVTAAIFPYSHSVFFPFPIRVAVCCECLSVWNPFSKRVVARSFTEFHTFYFVPYLCSYSVWFRNDVAVSRIYAVLAKWRMRTNSDTSVQNTEKL